METKHQKPGRFYLKWPWNLVVYILLAVSLRLFSIPIILLIMAWNKKQQPDGPEEGYCRQRTRLQLAYLGWGALFLFIGVSGIFVFFFSKLQEDMSRWELMDYITLVATPILSLGSLAFGLYEGYIGIRDALFPAKSRLAKSILSQLPYPDEAPNVKELFAMVDRDIRENGQWFDQVAVGKEWVFGDDVSAISRIRVVFGRNERVRYLSQRTQMVELYILDDRQQMQNTILRNPNELEPLLTCLKLRAPAAMFLPYDQYQKYREKTPEEWAQLERAYQTRKQQLSAEESETAPLAQHMVLTRWDGSVTSRVTPELLRQTLQDCLRANKKQVFVLTPSQPVEAEGHTLYKLECMAVFDGGTDNPDTNIRMRHVQLLLKAVPEQSGSLDYGYLFRCGVAQGEEILCAWLRGEAPNLRGWTSVQLKQYQRAQQKQQLSDKLSITDRTGVTRNYTTFTRRDVELAGAGLVSGKYVWVGLRTGADSLYIQSGTKEDGRTTVQASRVHSGKLRVFETKCRERQAQTWLLALADKNFAPDFSQWKDVTKRFREQAQSEKTKR